MAWKKTILYDCVIFIQEHEDEISVMNDDPINFHQEMCCFNSQ